MDLSEFELAGWELNEILRIGPHQQGCSLPALYQLFLFAVRPKSQLGNWLLIHYQREVIQRVRSLGRGPATELSLDSTLIWVNEYIHQWIEDWASQDKGSQIRWHLLHDALGTQILLAAHIAKKREANSASKKDEAVLLDTSTRLIVEALSTPLAPHMTTRASMFPYVAAILLKMSDRVDLVLRLALRMAGSPCKEQVPTCVWAAGRQMLAILWLVLSRELKRSLIDLI